MWSWACVQSRTNRQPLAVAVLHKFVLSLLDEIRCLQLLRNIMDQAVSSGLTVMRAMAFGVSPEYALETSPGQFSETIFRGMDYMLDQARQRGIKVSRKL